MTTTNDLLRTGSNVLAARSTQGAVANKMLMVSVVAGLMAAIPGHIFFPILAFLLVGGFLKIKS